MTRIPGGSYANEYGRGYRARVHRVCPDLSRSRSVLFSSAPYFTPVAAMSVRKLCRSRPTLRDMRLCRSRAMRASHSMHWAGRGNLAPADARSAGRDQRLCPPVKLSCEGRFCQFGRANAPMMPQAVQSILGPKAGTGTSSPKASTLMTASWWHRSQTTPSERTPCAACSRGSSVGRGSG